VLGTGGYFVHAVDACGCEAANWPKFTDGWIISTAAVGDIDGDHRLEIVTGTRDGNLFAWHTSGKDTGVIQWESFHHDNANTGNYGVMLDQGVLEGAGQPIDCATDCAMTPAPSSTQYTAGGCACRLETRDEKRDGAVALLLLTGLGAVLSRRRRGTLTRSAREGSP